MITKEDVEQLVRSALEHFQLEFRKMKKHEEKQNDLREKITSLEFDPEQSNEQKESTMSTWKRKLVCNMDPRHIHICLD